MILKYSSLFSVFFCVLCKRDPASEQLSNYKLSKTGKSQILTGYGVPINVKESSLTVGPRGPMLLQDVEFLDELSHFDRERIPERVVHAKGAGAFGYFEVTNDITRYTKSTVFETIGKRTPIAVRFSTVSGESGSADTVRDSRGFAIKFYTEDGIWDLVGSNIPVFFVRDPLLFPLFIHTKKRNPATHLKDSDMFWDFVSLRPETTHEVMMFFSDRGIPDGFRHMHGFGCHAFKMVNATNDAVYVKFHYKTNQGIKNLFAQEAENLTASDPDYGLRDLYNAIAEGNFPSWTLYIQVMTFEEAERFRWNPFDVTKVWPHAEYPLIPVGKLVLNRNPVDYFAEVEQIAFSPAHMIPGIEPSPDKMLQGRLFPYGDTQLHRLGANYLQIPVNYPFQSHVTNYQRDGPQTMHHQGGAPNYYPNSFGGPENVPGHSKPKFFVSGDVSRYNSTDEDNFSQPTLFWRNVLKPDEKERMVDNIVHHLKKAAGFLQDRTVHMFSQVDKEFANMLTESLKK